MSGNTVAHFLDGEESTRKLLFISAGLGREWLGWKLANKEFETTSAVNSFCLNMHLAEEVGHSAFPSSIHNNTAAIEHFSAFRHLCSLPCFSSRYECIMAHMAHKESK